MTLPFDIPRAIEMTTSAMLHELGDEIDIIFRYGSVLRGDTNRYSDLDISYVPRHENTWNSITVLVDDIMVDLYAIQWWNLEKMARFENVFNTILHDSEIIYVRDEEARARFQGLRDELRRNQKPEARPKMLRTAQELFMGSGYSYYLMRQEAEKGHKLATMQQAQSILQVMLHVIGVANQAAVDTRKLDRVYALPKNPAGLAESVGRIMGTTEPGEIVQATEALMASTHEMLLREQAEVQKRNDAITDVLNSTYPEFKGDIQHLILACERKDPYNFNLVQLMHELQLHMAWALERIDYSEFNSIADYEQDLVGLGFPDLLPLLERRDYAGLAGQVRLFDARLQEYLVEQGVSLNSFADLDELQAYLGSR